MEMILGETGLVGMQSGRGPGRLGGGLGRGVVAEEEGKGRDPLSLLDQVQAPRAGPFLPGGLTHPCAPWCHSEAPGYFPGGEVWGGG